MFMVLDLQVAFTCGAKSVDEAGASSEDAWKDGKTYGIKSLAIILNSVRSEQKN